jgi:hypothetical protein
MNSIALWFSKNAKSFLGFLAVLHVLILALVGSTMTDG